VITCIGGKTGEGVWPGENRGPLQPRTAPAIVRVHDDMVTGWLLFAGGKSTVLPMNHNHHHHLLRNKAANKIQWNTTKAQV